MVSRTVVLVLWLMLVLWVPANADAEEHQFSFSLKGNFTTGSQLFLNPDSPDDIQRAQYLAIEDFFGYSIEIRYLIPETNLAIALSTDYIRTTTSQSIIQGAQIPVKDGYRVIPIELTGYFIIPVSGPTFGIYMGGGGGAYFGRRIYEIAGVEAQTTDQGHGFGIHVLGGLSYRFTERFSLCGEMKFRDLQFKTTNQFSVKQVSYQGTVVSLPHDTFAARVHTDGVIFQIGASLSF
jgi:opacity protein-like surface antigen